MSFLKRVSSSFTSSFLGGGGGGRFARRRLTTDGSKEKKSLGVVRRSINYTNLLLVTKETALAKYASLFARDDAQKDNFEDNKEDKKLGGGSKVRWDRLKLRHEAHENAVAKGIPCDFDSFFLFPIIIERERERRKGFFGLRDDDVPLINVVNNVSKEFQNRRNNGGSWTRRVCCGVNRGFNKSFERRRDDSSIWNSTNARESE